MTRRRLFRARALAVGFLVSSSALAFGVTVGAHPEVDQIPPNPSPTPSPYPTPTPSPYPTPSPTPTPSPSPSPTFYIDAGR